MDFDAKVKQLKVKLQPRIERVLTDIGEAFKSEGWTWPEGICDMSDEEYSWSIQVYRPDSNDEDDSVDVTFTICEERVHEGGDDPQGVTFRLDVVEWGGAILGGMSPGNYTEDCWIDIDSDRLADRFELFTVDYIPAEVVCLCES